MHLHFVLMTILLAGSLFLAMLIFLEIGRRIGIRQTKKYGEGARVGVGVVDSAVYAVLALLLGFTFSGATSRFDGRRDLVVKEVNAITSAWKRVDALPATSQVVVRDAMRRYVDELIETYPVIAHTHEVLRGRDQMIAAQNDLWSKSLTACLAPGGEPARMLLLPALTEMFNYVDSERLARRANPPPVIYIMLAVAALAAAMFAGYAMSTGPNRNWLFWIGTAATISIVVYVILELEFPRLGLVRVYAIDQALVDVRASMK